MKITLIFIQRPCDETENGKCIIRSEGRNKGNAPTKKRTNKPKKKSNGKNRFT